MQQASDALAFERAATLRDRLVAIERTLDRQEVHSYKGDDFDVHAAAVEEGDAVVQVFRVRDGTVVSRDHFSLEGSEGALAPTSSRPSCGSTTPSLPACRPRSSFPSRYRKWTHSKRLPRS